MEDGKIASDEYTQDGTVDLKGRPILKSKSGGLKACFFIIVYELFERISYFGISSNLILYLTKELHQGTVEASNNVTNWIGTIWIAPIFGAFIADAWLKRYWVIVISSLIYFMGMSLLTLSVTLSTLKPPPCVSMNVTECKKASILQLLVFFSALYMLVVGIGGIKPNISTIGADQLDDFDLKEKTLKLSFFNWWMFFTVIGAVLSYTLVVYVQDNLGWTLGYGIPTIVYTLSIVTFLAGTPFYRHKLPSGSPFTRMAKVIVASLRKWKVHIPKDSKELYEIDFEKCKEKGEVIKIDHTPTLRFLDKACVITTSSTSSWMLCSITQVEETKQILRMLPIFITTCIPSTILAQVNTLFVKQGTTLNRNIGNFNIPPASIHVFVTVTMAIGLVLYDRFFVKIMQRFTKNPRGITLLQRMGIGIITQIFVMIIASLIERYRLSVAKEHGIVENGSNVPLSILILIPQYIAMGIAETFLAVANIEFFYDQAPITMKSLGISYSMTSLGIGHFLSSFILSTISYVTKDHGQEHGWISNNLNVSHLDYYYALLAGIGFLNYVIFVIVAKFYVYRVEVSNLLKVLEEELKAKTSIESN